MQAVGLSMALGAFLAGVLLAESEYRHALETDIEPFKGLLLGLFFIAVGMSIDFAVVLAQPLRHRRRWWSASSAIKALRAVRRSRARMPLPAPERPVFVVLLAQGGEFGFVVFQTRAAGAARSTRRPRRCSSPRWRSRCCCRRCCCVAADRWLTPRLRAPRREGARGTRASRSTRR